MALAKILVDNVRKGDQLFLDGYMENNHWIDNNDRKHYDFSFIIQGFKFGAPGKIKRAELAARVGHSAPATPTDPTPPPASANGRTRRGKPANGHANGESAGPRSADPYADYKVPRGSTDKKNDDDFDDDIPF